MHTQRISIIAGVMLIALSIPFIFKWPWTSSDFVVAGILIFGTGLLIDLALRKFGKNRMWVVAGIVFLFLWLWAELAVGVFTDWGS